MENGNPKGRDAATEPQTGADTAPAAAGPSDAPKGAAAVAPPKTGKGDNASKGTKGAKSAKAAKGATGATEEGAASGVASGDATGAEQPDAREKKERSGTKRKLKPEAILTHAFGDLMKFSKKAPDVQAPFRKYDTFAVAMVEQPREERLMMYGFLMGLTLTAHARRIKDAGKRRSVFDLKNRLFLAVANNFALRKVLNFRLCQSKRFKVLKYCADCVAKNTESGLPQRQWKFCPKCNVDRNYYNVLSMFHKHGEGGASIFLGNELIPSVRGLRVLKRAKYGQLDEEVTFRKYTFSPKNLVALDLASAMEAARKVTEQLEKARDAEVEKQAAHYAQTGVGFRPRPFGAAGAGPVGQGGFGGPSTGAPRGPFPRREGPAAGFAGGGPAQTADGVRRTFTPGFRPAPRPFAPGASDGAAAAHGSHGPGAAHAAPGGAITPRAGVIKPRDPSAGPVPARADGPNGGHAQAGAHGAAPIERRPPSDGGAPREAHIRPRPITAAPGATPVPSRIVPAARPPSGAANVDASGGTRTSHGAPGATQAEPRSPAEGGTKPEGEGSK